MSPTEKKLVSIVLPVYNEEAGIEAMYEELKKSIGKEESRYDFQVIFVNDGSRDSSLEKLISLQEGDPKIIVIDFSRNFGHQLAITAGIDFAEGDAVIIMDSDLQDPPHVAMEMLRKWEEGFDVVYAQRKTRKDTMFKRATASMFYKVLGYFTNFRIPENTGDFRLLDRKVVDELKKFREANRFMRGLVSYLGFKQAAHLFDRDERFAGKTHYPLSKMLKLAFDGILSFSTVPLKLIIQLGMLVSFLSMIGIFYAIWMFIFHPEITVPGWTLMMIAILFIGGVQMLMLGVLGAYLGRIYSEVQNRPLYIVDTIYGQPSRKQ